MNNPYRLLNFSWAVYKSFGTSKRDILLGWWTDREVAVTISTLTGVGTLLCFFIKDLFDMKLKQLRSYICFARQLFNEFYEYNQNFAEAREVE